MTLEYPFTECCQSTQAEIVAIVRHMTNNSNFNMYNLGKSWSYKLVCYGKKSPNNKIQITIR